VIEGGRWARLDALLDAALDRPAEERRPFLRSACADDEELFREALSLLELAERDDPELGPDAVAGTPWDDVPAQDDNSGEAPLLATGTPVGPYRVLGLLGRGGMGYVYEAEDPKLGRRVALKVLPPELDTHERRRRFEREARTLAQLNHPNIVHVYSVEESGAVRFIAMERIVGRTLAERIEAGGMPLPELLDVAIPLAEALAAAHARGVVHRDLKPANVMISDDGHVKVLDFGVAKWSSGAAVVESSAATREGVVVGTASYMSPEQAQGGEVDHRSDVFALGVILFQMGTGELPFRGGSSASVISSILRDTPPSVTDLQPRLPRELSAIVKRCLAKDPGRRYASAGEIRRELEALRLRLATGERAATAGRRYWAIGAAAAALAVALAVALPRLAERKAPPLEGTFAPATSTPGPEFFPTLSPDGQLLAYAGRAGGGWDIFLQRVGGQRPINLTAEWRSDDVQPAFSPDGRSIAFRSSRDGGGLFVMGATGESARRVADRGFNPSWSPDGREIAFATRPVFESPYDRPTASELWAVRLEDGRTRRITGDDAVQPAWSPHARRLAFWGLVKGGSRRDVWTVPAGGGPAVPVTQDEAVDWSPAWSPDGRFLYFSSDRGGSMNLWRIAIDEDSGRVRGEPERVTTPAAFAHHASFSREGARLAYVSTSIAQELQRVRFDPVAERVTGPPEPLARDVRRLAFPHVSPDGQWIVYSQTEPQEDLLLSRLDGSERRALTSDAYRDRRPRFSPDGSRIAFYSNRGGNYEIWTVARDGSGLRQLTSDPQRRNARYPIWSPDGSRLLYSRPGVTGLVVEAGAELDAPPLLELRPHALGADSFVALDWSADGRSIAGMVVSEGGERSGIAVYDLERESYATLAESGTWPQWLPDGRRLVFQGPSSPPPDSDRDVPRGESLFLLDRATGRARELLSLPEVTLGYPSVSPDGAWLVFVHTTVEADVWILTSDATPADRGKASATSAR
jgi:Tol biopolymer transport system component/predicted Ser/Thr protein kinase